MPHLELSKMLEVQVVRGCHWPRNDEDEFSESRAEDGGLGPEGATPHR